MVKTDDVARAPRDVDERSHERRIDQVQHARARREEIEQRQAGCDPFAAHARETCRARSHLQRLGKEIKDGRADEIRRHGRRAPRATESPILSGLGERSKGTGDGLRIDWTQHGQS